MALLVSLMGLSAAFSRANFTLELHKSPLAVVSSHEHAILVEIRILPGILSLILFFHGKNRHNYLGLYL